MRTAPAATFRHGATPVDLCGSAFDRGRRQTERCPDTAPLVRDAVERRLAPVRAILARPPAAEFISRQWEFTAEHDPHALAEVEGIASGYGIQAQDLFASLHAAMLLGFDESAAVDGCSAWALPHPEFGALLGKNRDLAGAFHATQRVFRHRDPAWNGRVILCIGSLGAPGVYSSGVNSDGLALADTQVRAAEQGVGLLRYFAMTRVLARCATIGEALEELRGVRHAGGGSLLLADAQGGTAAVELGRRGPAIERSASGRIARTNHFVSPELRGCDLDGGDRRANSEGRLRRLSAWLGGLGAAVGIADAAGAMASHDDADAPGLCRHGGERGSTTISGSVFACRGRRLYLAESNPCSGAWTVYDCRQEAAKAAGSPAKTGQEAAKASGGLAKHHGGGA